MNNEQFVKWKCPECGNYHKWAWNIYDIIGGETTMVCDNPECGATSKMFMIVEKGGNATAFDVDNSQVEATEKVMNSQTEIDISKVLIDGDEATIMGVKYRRIIYPQSFYDALQCPLHINGYHFNEDQKDWICDIVKEWLPDEVKYDGEEYDMGWNECIRKIEENLK